MLPGILIVFLFYVFGEILGWLLGGYVPGSVVGMILLFAALCMKIVNPQTIKPVVKFLCDNMSLFFVPAGVGIVNAMDVLSANWEAILTASALSTVLIIIVVSLIQQSFEKRRK